MATTFTPFADLGTEMPVFSLPDLNGKVWSQKDFQIGQPVVFMFICNHCPYVQAVEDRLIQLGHDLKKQNVPVVAICSNDAISHPEDSLENTRKRAQEKGFSFTYLYDASQTAAQAFGAVCTPDFFVYDKNIKLAYRGRLDNSWKDASKVTQRELFDSVQLLVRGEKVSEQQTASMGCSIKWI